MANINKIRLSGQTYNIQDQNATKTLELTQAQYDALTVKGPNTFYIITDAQGADLSQYYTSAQTESAITQAVSGKADTSAVTESINAAVSGKVDTTTYSTYTAATDTAIAGKQDTLVSGTNIKTINNESILGSGNIDIQGGGKAVSAGTNISITTGETADTINCTLPIVLGGTTSSTKYLSFDGSNTIDSHSYNTNVFGMSNTIYGGSNLYTFKYNNVFGSNNTIKTTSNTDFINGYCAIFGYSNSLIGKALNHSYAFGQSNVGNKSNEFISGFMNIANNYHESTFGRYNVSSSASTTFGDSGNTLFSVGNGTADNARHNAFEIRQNGDIYITSGGTDIKLQDNLGGGGSSYTAGTGIDITNDVISVSGVVMSSAVTSAVTSGSTDVVTSGGVYDQLGGIKIVKLTESEYTALVTKDSDTLYVVIPDPSN